MKIGIVADGQAEVPAIGALCGQLRTACGNVVLNPVFAPIPPLAEDPRTIARAAKGRVEQIVARGAERVVVIVDHETRDECPGAWAETLEHALRDVCDCDIWVVIKHRMFENWLVADIDAICAHKDHDVSNADRRSVQPDKADRIDALKLLKKTSKGNYSKVRDGQRIMERADCMAIALHSRSFRRFLRLCGEPTYRDQSRRPARPARPRG